MTKLKLKNLKREKKLAILAVVLLLVFGAPDVSPDLHLLGPLGLYE